MTGAPQVVVITGASAGVGRATAQLFARHGARIALLARGSEGLAEAAREVVAAGGEALPIATDVADAAQVEAAAERVEAELGPIDVWVNCAMATIFSPIAELDAAEFRRATEVTYHGAVYGTLAAYRRMRPRNRGSIVQVGSALAYRSIPLQAAYCGAKSGLRGFTDSLRSELIHDRSAIQVTMVHLSAFNTPQFLWGRTKLARRAKPLAPIFQPEFAARAIHWAATHRRRELWVGFPAYQAIIGQRLWPALGDHFLARAAWQGQMTDEPVASVRPDNLFTPAPGDFGTHGPFDASARAGSLQLALTTHRAVVGAALAALAIGALAWLRAKRRR